MKKLAIIGGGVAGMSAALYALRANCQVTVFDAYGLGGLVATIDQIQNYPALPNVNGYDLVINLSSQVRDLGVKVVRQRVISLTKQDGQFVIATDSESYVFPSVIIAVGASHNKLGFEAEFIGKGVSYCATCDGNFFRNCPVAVVGSNNRAVSEATYLADICSVVYVICPQKQLSSDEFSVIKLTNKPNVKVLYDTTVTAIRGNGKLEQIQISDRQKSTLKVDGLFVAIGAKPNLDFVKIDSVINNLDNGYIAVDGKCQTAEQGLFCAGDCTNGALKQIVTACADGAKAGTFASAYCALSDK